MSLVLPPKQFKADATYLTTADSGWRDPKKCQIAVFHTTENSDSTPPDSVAKWQGDPSNNSSYTVIFGTDGRVVRVNDDDYSPWAAGQTANRRGLHGSAIGYASRSRSDWLSHPLQINAMAKWAADVSARYGIPLVWLTPEQVRSGKRGFCSHDTVSKAWGEVNHTDPGPGFPHDVVLGRAKKLLETPPPPAPSTPPAHAAATVDLVLDQLAGHPWAQFPGWSQLGGRTVVDALAAIGADLKIPGFKDTKGGQ